VAKKYMRGLGSMKIADRRRKMEEKGWDGAERMLPRRER
jgi:hypothetical protein